MEQQHVQQKQQQLQERGATTAAAFVLSGNMCSASDSPSG